MYKTTITYEDFNGDTVQQDLYFNISKMESVRLDSEYQEQGGLSTYLQKVIDENDYREIIRVFEWFVQQAYGEKSPDGKRFIKVDPETGRPLYENFKGTIAYDDFVWSLATDAQKASDFVTSILPAEALRDAMKNVKLPEGVDLVVPNAGA